jgi:hypothetical protein
MQVQLAKAETLSPEMIEIFGGELAGYYSVYCRPLHLGSYTHYCI